MARPPPALLRILLSAGLLAAVGEAAAATDFQASCEGRQSSVTIDANDSGYRIDNSLSYRSLTQIKRPAARDGYVLGMTRAESRVTISVEGAILGDPETGMECLQPQIGVSLSYLPIVVYVGSEFTPGTCAYREILAHEMRHLKAYVDYLPKVESRVREKLADRFDTRPVVAPQGQALARVQREMDERWMPVIKREMARAKALQAGIDTPHEYARLSKICRGEVQSLIRSTRRSSS
jgi:hypothetical protein